MPNQHVAEGVRVVIGQASAFEGTPDALLEVAGGRVQYCIVGLASALPLIKDGALIGVLDVDSPVLNRFDDTDKAAFETIAALFCAGSD